MRVQLEKEDLGPVTHDWGFCLIGCFTGRFPGGKAIYDLKATWKVKCKVIPHSRGWTIFAFEKDVDRKKVLGGGPYTCYGKTLMLKEVNDKTRFDHDLFLDIPLWVKFYDVPLNCWTEGALSKIASMLGKPLHTDQVTKDRSYASYARALVEVDVRGPPIFEYEVVLPEGPSYVQRVDYENYPDYCYHCKRFGHSYDSCKELKAKENVEGANDTSSPIEEEAIGETIGAKEVAQVEKIKEAGDGARGERIKGAEDVAPCVETTGTNALARVQEVTSSDARVLEAGMAVDGKVNDDVFTQSKRGTDGNVSISNEAISNEATSKERNDEVSHTTRLAPNSLPEVIRGTGEYEGALCLCMEGLTVDDVVKTLKKEGRTPRSREDIKRGMIRAQKAGHKFIRIC